MRMVDEKDRYGEKLRDVERAREDQWAKEQDRILIEKMRKKLTTEPACPRCREPLVPKADGKIAWMACPNGHGAWLDAETLSQISKGSG